MVVVFSDQEEACSVEREKKKKKKHCVENRRI